MVLGVLALFLERKLIGIAQKRLGISFLGRNGWAHLPADLVKFWLKHTARHHGS
jgi:NADH:ubiquinone oxidoreductase subunit H